MIPTRLLNVPQLAAIAFVGFGLSTAHAHDPDEHHYYDHVRANRLSHHAKHDRDHAEQAMDRAYATGNPRDFIHALRDRSHTKRARRAAHHAQDHARGHRY